jgi:hypothetical protein
MYRYQHGTSVDTENIETIKRIINPLIYLKIPLRILLRSELLVCDRLAPWEAEHGNNL